MLRNNSRLSKHMIEPIPTLTAVGTSRTVQRMVVETLRNAILEGDLLPGTKLDQQHIAEQLKVSRMPVRQALLALEAEGLVVSHPHRTAYVAEFSPEAIDEIFAIRALLESTALGLAVPHLTARDCEQAQQLHERMGPLLRNDQTWAQTNQEFHLTLYRPCARHQLLTMIEDLRLKTLPYIRVKLALSADMITASYNEHAAILAACLAGDADLAAAHVKRHILHVGRVLVHTYSEGRGVVPTNLMSDQLDEQPILSQP